jgi:AcrR family transcriptional regulator
VSDYNSPRRTEAAAATKQAILDAARKLFTEKGYAATTVGDIAKAARVAPATVYTSVGGKQLLLAEIARAGAADPALGSFMAALARVKDPREAIRLAAAGTRYSAEKNADLLDIIAMNAPFDEVVAEIAEDAERRFRYGAGKLVRRLRELKALRGSLAEAEDVVVYFFGHSSWRRVIADLGWTYDKAEQWLTTRAIEALVG